MSRPRPIAILAGIGLLIVAVAALVVPRLNGGGTTGIEVADIVPVRAGARKADTGLCPWRNPEADLKQFFTASDTTRDETLVLSGFRPAIAQRLGHPPVGGDSVLKVHRVLRNGAVIGAILTRNVRGESGVIELVLGVDTAGCVVGARLQRLREPDDVARALQSSTWLGAFRGKTAASEWRLGRDLPDVPSAARPSAAEIAEGARTVLVLLDVGKKASILR
jgi:hypothetical protein